MANVFRRGHRIRLDVTSSSFPRFSRNLNTGEDVGTGTRMEVARQTVLHTARYPSHVVLPVIGVVTGDGGFPTYEAERALEAARAAGIEPVPLAGTPSPPLPDHVVEAVAAVLRRPMAAPPPRGLVGAARGARRRARAVDGTRRRPGDGDRRHERGHARPRDLLPLARPARRRGRRAGSLLLLRGPDPGGRRDAGLRPLQPVGRVALGAEALERAIGPRTSAFLLCNPGNPTGHVPPAEEVADAVAVAARHGLARRHRRGLRGCALGRRDAHLGLRPRRTTSS